MIHQLDNEQLETFDTEYVNEPRWQMVKAQIEQSFPSGEFSFLDVGGGNGRFADRLLAAYPRAVATVLDNSELLLERNRHHDRKTLINASVTEIKQYSQRYDLISLNWLLHHLVGDSYAQSRQNIVSILTTLPSLLTDRGRVSIFENMYEGLWLDGLPSRLIFQLTASKTIARFMRQQGANTAGVGVCFLSHKQWCAVLAQSGWQILQYTNDAPWITPAKYKLFLHVGSVRCGHFWLSPSASFSPRQPAQSAPD